MQPSSLLIAPILFFSLGFFAQVLKSGLRLPPEVTKALSMYLLAGIGLQGGAELAHVGLGSALHTVAASLVLGFCLPLLAFGLLRAVCRLDRFNAAAIAAHYGSVSAGTFLSAIAYLQLRDISYESHVVVMLAVMESPAILVGLLLAQVARRGQDAAGTAPKSVGSIMREALSHGSVVLLIGTTLIGMVITPASLNAIIPFFKTIFMGALCLFLLDMGIDVATRFAEFRTVGGRLLVFGIVMPLLGGATGLLIGHAWLGFGVGGTMLVALLAASASYIVVPPVVRLAIPEANPSFYLTLSLGITFPFNVLVGIPLFLAASQWLRG